MIAESLNIVARQYLESLQEGAGDPKQRPLPLPLEVLQKALGGLRPGEVTILGGFEGHGKSALAQQIALGVAEGLAGDEGGSRVHYHSLEMGKFQLAARFLVQKTGLPLHKLLNPNRLASADWKVVKQALQELGAMPLDIFDAAKQSTMNIYEAITAAQKASATPKLLVIDYFHLLTDCVGGEVARLDAGIVSLKDLSRSANCHIIALARLNRNVQPGQLPSSHNISGSQGLAYTADNVLFVHKPKQIDHSLDEEWDDFTYLVVDKQRNGPTGVHHMMWEPERLCFRDLTKWEADRPWQLPKPQTSRFNY